jgi:ATP-dependent RNA helicase SUPV3L1/SUV3
VEAEAVPAPELAVEATPEVVAEAPLPAPEVLEVAVWWPEGMGPFKAKPVRSEKPRPDHTKRDHKHTKKPFDKSARKPEVKPERPKRPEKPMDPNSPFAALAALKASMGKGNG